MSRDRARTHDHRIGSHAPYPVAYLRWEDAKRAYHKFINDEKIMRYIQRNPCTLRYTYSYTLIYTLHIEYTQNNRLLHKIIGTKE